MIFRILLLSVLIQGFAFAGIPNNVNDSLNENDSISCKRRQAIEVESLFPMFFYGGYHLGAGYRYENFRIRISVIYGGKYNTEPAGLKNDKENFKRYYKPSPGLFLGYNIWKNLELYTFIENHTFQIEEKATGIKKDINSTDFGGGVSYQFFIGDVFYIQPGAHIYLRSEKKLFFPRKYQIPKVDLSPVIRIGFRLWEKS